MTKKKKKPKKARIFWDIETNPFSEFEASEMFMKCVVFVTEGSDTPHVCLNEKEVLQYIVEFAGCVFIAHNGGKFDNVWLINLIQRDGRKASISCAMQGSRILYMDVMIGGESSRFLDSFALFPTSLDKIAKSFGMEGKKYPEKYLFLVIGWSCLAPSEQAHEHKMSFLRHATIEEIVTYCIDDVLMLKRSFLLFERTMLEQFNVEPSITSAATAYKVFCENYKWHPLYCRDVWNENIRKYGYFGGRVELFRKGIIEEKISVFDVNSLYPYCMLGDVPFGTPRIITGKEKNKVVDTDFYYVEVTVTNDAGVLPFYHEKHKKLFFPKGTFWGYYTGLDLKMLDWTGGSYKIDCRIAFRAKPLFKEYVKTIYAKRQIAKETGDTGFDLTLKLLLNSLYGKFGMKRERTQIILSNEVTQEDLESGVWVPASHEWHLCPQVTDVGFADQSVATSAYITSKARSILLTAIVNNYDRAVYCDTDSLHIIGGKEDFYGCVDQTKLGAWKYEGTFDRGIYHAPKVYKLEGHETKKAHKGFSRFPEQIQDHQEKPSVDPLKTMLKKGVFGSSITTKSLLAKTEKRRYEGAFSYPLDIDDLDT